MHAPDVRPIFRGWLHALAFVAAIPAGVLLLLDASGPAAKAAATVYAASLALLFGTSAGYHCLARSGRAREVLQRLDHSMIYVLIAGTYTPVCLLALPLSWGIPLLAVVGAGAVVGIVCKCVAFHGIGRYANGLYLVMGWIAVIAAPMLGRTLSSGQVALLVLGGVAYTVGFPVLMLRRPNPWPRVFGYHELWHVFTVVAGGLHFAAVATLVS